MNYLLRSLCFMLLLPGAVCAQGTVAGAGTPHVIRVMTVVIVQQEGFLPWLLEPFLAGRDLGIEYTQGHHTEVARAVTEGRVDLVIAHTKVRLLREQSAQGILNPGRPLFANPMAFLGPRGDPARIRALNDPVQALRRIQAAGFCYVINRQDRLGAVQDALLGQLDAIDRKCLIDAVANRRDAALVTAGEKGAYTLWGLHPAVQRGDGRLEPVVIADARLLSELSGYVVRGGAEEVLATEILDYLASAPAQRRLTEFRFSAYPELQPWWPVQIQARYK
jgi:tungstate transport system substrate-binding protein